MDVGQIVRNSQLYNGAKSVLTQAAQRMLDLCLQRLAEASVVIIRLHLIEMPYFVHFENT